MTTSEWIAAIIPFALAGALLILGVRHFREEGVLLNNAWLYASPEERKTMNKKPYYRQSAVVFCILSAAFVVVGLSLVLRNDRVLLLEILLIAAAIIYAIVSSVRIIRMNKNADEAGEEACVYEKDGRIDFKTLFDLFDSKAPNIDETSFCFRTDPNRVEHFIGYLPQYEAPYWIGLCDIDGGCSFETAKELFEAPVFDGRSIKDRWDEVVLLQIGAIGMEDWRAAQIAGRQK